MLVAYLEILKPGWNIENLEAWLTSSSMIPANKDYKELLAAGQKHWQPDFNHNFLKLLPKLSLLKI